MQKQDEEDKIIQPRNQQQRYKKIKVLGEGSMGKAYLVECFQDHKLYVMKRVNIGHLKDQFKQKAMLQAQLHSQLHHPNIIQFKEIYHTTNDKLCIIMEYAEDGDLDQFIAKQNGKYFQEETVLKLFTQICLGVKEIHDRKIIHRDLKGANIFITSDKSLKIGDFGISKMLDQTILASKSFVGTPYYLSPEMVEGKNYSTKADIWALGVILYQLCALKLPFQTNSLPLLALKIIKGSFPPLTGGGYSKQLKNVILNLLQVDQKKRSSIDEILNKPIFQKYLPKEFIPKNIEKNVIKSTKNVISPPIPKPGIKKIKISEQQLKEKQKLKKEENKEKRQEMRRQMREDLKKKRQKKEKTNQQNLEINSSTIELKPKNKRQKTQKTLSKPEIEYDDKKNVSKEQVQSIKPWKNKNNKEKKQLPIQIYLPENRPKQQKINQQPIHSSKDIKVQIFVSGKPYFQNQQAIPNSGDKPIFRKQQSKPHHNKNDSQIVSKKLISEENQQIEDEQSSNKSSIQQDIEQGYNIDQILKDVKGAGQLVKNLNNPFGPIQLYEESQTFENNIGQVTKCKNKSVLINKQEISLSKNDEENMRFITNSQNLQELRLILEDRLGEQNFIKSYNMIKEHIQQAAILALQRQNNDLQQEEDYAFNRQILRKKLQFISNEQFQTNIILLYTLTILEDQQLQSNFEDDI